MALVLSQTGGGGSGGGYTTIEDDGIALVQRSTLNFEGAGVTCTDDGVSTTDCVIPGGGGAPDNATYVVISLDPTLSDERVLTGTANQVIINDNGAGSTVVLSLPQDIATTSGPTFASLNIDTDIALTGSGASTATEERIYHLSPGSIGIASRDIIELIIDSNNNSTSTLNIKANGLLSSNIVAFINESGVYVSDSGWAITDGTDTLTVTAPSLTANRAITFPDSAGEITLLGQLISPDDFDNLDSPADEECATYEAGQIEWQTCGSGGVALSNDLPITSGASSSTSIYYGIPGITFQGSGGAFVVANDIYLAPFQVTEDITINSVSMLVTSAGNPADGCRVGLYNTTDGLQPTSLLVDWGVIVNDSTGNKFATVSTALTAGIYLEAILCNSGPAFQGYNGKSYLSGGVSTDTTSTTRLVNLMRVSSPTAGQYAGGFEATGDEWDTVDLSATFNYGYWLLMRW
jgi:hypothetical protein